MNSGNPRSSFGEYLKHVRVSNGLTLADVARTIGVSISYLSDVEHGRRHPFGLPMLKRFADTCDTDLHVLALAAAQERGSVTIESDDTAVLSEAVYLAISALQEAPPC